MEKKLGIIGGMGPLATADLFTKVILATRAERDQDHIHQIIDNNTGIPDRTSFIMGNGKDPLPQLIESASRLENMGADFLVMPCNTAHYFYDDIVKNINIPFLNMVESTSRFCENSFGEDSKIGLLATDGTCASGVYDKFFKASKCSLVKPDTAHQKLVMKFIYDIKEGKKAETDYFYKTVKNLKEQGACAFILGCTELSYAKESFGIKGDFVDPLRIIAKRAVEFAKEK